MKKKRILFVINRLNSGGTERVLIPIVNRLVQEDYDITVHALCPGNIMRDTLDSRVLPVYKSLQELPGKRIPYIRYKLYDDEMWVKRCTQRQYYRYYIGREKFDYEVAFFHEKPLKLVSGSNNPSAKRIAWVHIDFANEKGITNAFRSKEDLIEAYRKTDHVVCVTEIAAKSFLKVIGEVPDLRVIRNFLPVGEIIEKAKEPANTALPDAKLRLVCVGRLRDREKGQARLIEAVAALKAAGADLSLTLVGGGNDEAAYRELIEKADAASYITLTGRQENPYPYIKAADLLVCSSYAEGYNLTVAEALILGVPVLSTDCAGPREILDNGRYGMITGNSREGLYNGIKKLYDDPTLLEEYRQKTAERQDYFDEDEIFGQILDLFGGRRSAAADRHPDEGTNET